VQRRGRGRTGRGPRFDGAAVGPGVPHAAPPARPRGPPLGPAAPAAACPGRRGRGSPPRTREQRARRARRCPHLCGVPEQQRRQGVEHQQGRARGASSGGRALARAPRNGARNSFRRLGARACRPTGARARFAGQCLEQAAQLDGRHTSVHGAAVHQSQLGLRGLVAGLAAPTERGPQDVLGLRPPLPHGRCELPHDLHFRHVRHARSRKKATGPLLQAAQLQQPSSCKRSALQTSGRPCSGACLPNNSSASHRSQVILYDVQRGGSAWRAVPETPDKAVHSKLEAALDGSRVLYMLSSPMLREACTLFAMVMCMAQGDRLLHGKRVCVLTLAADPGGDTVPGSRC